MDAYYDSLKAGPWVGLSWWVWDWTDASAGIYTHSYLDGSLKEYTSESKEGRPYPEERQTALREQFLASRHSMFEDTVYNQFGHLNPRPAISGEARR